MRTLFAILGPVILLATMIDVIWTTIGTHGGGPMSSRIASAIWGMALAMHRRRRHHRALSFVGSLIVVVNIAFWIGMIWLGWFLLFSSDPSSLRDPHTGIPADAGGRLFFVAYAMSSMGNGDYQPVGLLWQILSSVATLSGVGTITLAITFVLEVLSAVVEKRALGAYISDLGTTAERIINRAWSGEKFDATFEEHLVQLTTMIHIYTEQHLAYPVLHQYHSERKRTAAGLRIVTLHDVLVLVSRGVVPERRPSRIATEPLRDAIRGLSAVVGESFVPPADRTPQPPSLDVLRELGIPCVSDEEFRKSLESERDVRRFLLGLVDHDGWSWGQAESTES